jgi:hypothetical protein
MEVLRSCTDLGKSDYVDFGIAQDSEAMRNRDTLDGRFLITFSAFQLTSDDLPSC